MKEKKTLGRREFTVASAMAVLSGVAITISACGGSSSSGSNPMTPSNPAPPGAPGDVTGVVGSNHGHAAVITSAQLTAGGDLSLDIMGSANHTHNVELTAADIGSIAGGGSVAKGSTTTNGHSHSVTFN